MCAYILRMGSLFQVFLPKFSMTFLSHACYISWPWFFRWFDSFNNILWGVEIYETLYYDINAIISMLDIIGNRYVSHFFLAYVFLIRQELN
jgi:hypothetical protein